MSMRFASHENQKPERGKCMFYICSSTHFSFCKECYFLVSPEKDYRIKCVVGIHARNCHKLSSPFSPPPIFCKSYILPLTFNHCMSLLIRRLDCSLMPLRSYPIYKSSSLHTNFLFQTPEGSPIK